MEGVSKAYNPVNTRPRTHIANAEPRAYLYNLPPTRENMRIRILPLAYFLATKFNAFHERGGSDARASHDFEDITYILDNRVDLPEIISKASADVKKYLQSEFLAIIEQPKLQEALQGNLYYETRSIRYDMIIEKLNRIV